MTRSTGFVLAYVAFTVACSDRALEIASGASSDMLEIAKGASSDMTDRQSPSLDLAVTWPGDMAGPPPAPADMASSQPVFSGAPPGLLRPAMAFDSTRNVTILFGGLLGYPATEGEAVATGETWRLEDATWTRVSMTGPTPRYGAGMAYDPVRDRVVLYGGHSRDDYVGYVDDYGGGGCSWDRSIEAADVAFVDTWEWDGTTWTESSASSPPGLSGRPAGASLAYNPIDHLIYMAHGSPDSEQGFDADAVPGTWTWDGSTWSQISDTNPTLDGITYDASRGKLVGYHGRGGSGFTTYEWSGSSWDEVGTPDRPSNRARAVFAYHPARGGVVLIGGFRSVPEWGDDSTNEIWQYDGSNWVKQDSGDAPYRGDWGYTFDLTRSKVITFGGTDDYVKWSNDTWIY